MITINNKIEAIFTKEQKFQLFRYNDLWCVVQMINIFGQINGYVAVSKASHLYGKNYDDLNVSVHGGLTYSKESLNVIDQDCLDQLWWFGFDTAHSGDLKPFQTDIDRKYLFEGDEYRDFNYVKEQTIRLAEQISKL